MINYKNINVQMIEGSCQLEYNEPAKVFAKIYKKYKYKFLFESKSISNIYGRLSLIGIDPVLVITGKNNNFEIKSLNERGISYLRQITENDLSICDNFEKNLNEIRAVIKKDKEVIDEANRTKRKNISNIIRLILDKFKINGKSFIGLYGAFSYDFVRLFEDISDIAQDSDVNDFTLFLYDSFIFFDHLKERTELIIFRENKNIIEEDIKEICSNLDNDEANICDFAISDQKFLLNESEYKDLVKIAQDYALEGEIFEVVFSNTFTAKFEGDTFGLYLKYREANPSPYLFYFDFGDEELVGASPEMMVRVENNIVNLRPISGTAKRGADIIEDHENMLCLLNDKKEKAELDMLIDLGRNDLSRVCKENLEVTDYRFVEKYSKVMHTVAHIKGHLKEGFVAFDALIASLNAGTLTGAPKVAAMNIIEKHEKYRRGYYGGTIGYLTFSGEMDSGIIIRTAHIKNGNLKFQVGATLLYKSDPEKEYEETLSKAKAFLNLFNN